MKRHLVKIRSFVEKINDQLKSLSTQDYDLALEQFRTLPVMLAAFEDETSYEQMMSVIHSILTDPVRGMEREKLLQGVQTILAMVANLQSDHAHLNEKLEQQFFKQWLSPKFQPSRQEGSGEEISSADFLGDSQEGNEDLLQFFSIEAKENLVRMRVCVSEMNSEKRWREALAEFRAIVHTLKGSAAIIGDKEISRVAHALEETLDLKTQPTQPFINMLDHVGDAFKWLIEHLTPADSPIHDATARNAHADMAVRLIEDYHHQAPLFRDQPLLQQSLEISDNQEAKSGVSSVVTVEQLSNLMEESDATRAMLMEDVRQIRAIAQSLSQSSSSMHEFAGQMRGKASEAQKRLKLRLKEASSDLEEYHRLFEQRLEGCQEGLDKLQELSTRLWKEIARSRRIPIGRLFGVLQKTVKELALEQGLEVQLVTAGGDIQVEKKLFETLFDPLLQLIRNALSHGIEPPEQRLKLGKNPLGTIRLMIEGQEDDLMITVEDDGRGLAGKTILQRAKLLFGPHAVNDGIDELIFLSGLTTKKDISEVAGRGIGMDVVATGINKLNGIIQVESEPGKFTRFHLRLPANRFYASVYIVRSMGHLFAIPTALVNADDRQNRFFHRSRYPIISLTSVLGGRGINRPSLLVGAVEKRFYLEVDEIIGVQSVVFTKLGRFFKNLPLVWGATLIRDGEMAFVLNLRYLFDAASKGVRAGRKFRERQHLIQRQTHEAATILVVDDSISVREFVSSILTTNGFRSHVAKDGQEALQLLQQRSYRLLITDLEMPRLDGHQLIDKLNAHHYESNVRRPEVLVITSRSEREERKRLLAKGVSELLSKPFNEKELLGAVNRLLSNANDRSNEFSGEMIYDTQSPDPQIKP